MKKLLALAMVALMATPAFAAVQNVKVSGDIDSTYLSRDAFGLGQKAATGIENVGLVNQSVFITQTRLRVDADLSDNVSTAVGLINERAWGAEGATDTNVQLYLASATFRELLYSPLSVTVGRQVFNYGNGLIIGNGGANNVATGNLGAIAADLTKRTSYDGVKAVLDYKPLTLDLIYFKNGSGVVTGANFANKDDSDVLGANANYNLGDSMNTVVEGYIFARINGKHNATIANPAVGTPTGKGDELYVPGLRVSTNPVKGLNTQAELAWQLGTKSITSSSGAGATAGGDNVRRSAIAAQLMASYEVPVLEQYKPLAAASYTWISGDKNGSNARPTGPTPGSRTTYSAWDPLNESQGSGTIYNTLFDLTNMHIISASLQAKPIEDVTAKFTWSNLRAAQKISAANLLTFRQPDSTATAAFAGTTSGSKDMGNEYDVNVNYAYSEDVTFGVSMGWYVPGNLFTAANDSVASQALAHVNVNF